MFNTDTVASISLNHNLREEGQTHIAYETVIPFFPDFS